MSDTAKALIAEKLKSKGLSENMVGSMEYKYVDLDTGLYFETYDGHAMYSPFTGGTNIEMANDAGMVDVPTEVPMSYEAVNPAEYMKPSPVPGNQGDPYMQNPLMPNPVPPSGPTYSPNTPITGNPAPDVQGQIGADDADPKGYVPYPSTNVPPHKKKTPGDRTDSAPGGSK